MRPIRTVAEVGLEFAVFTRDPFEFQRIAGEAGRLRQLGMSFRAIGLVLGLDGKTVRKALARSVAAESRAVRRTTRTT